MATVEMIETEVEQGDFTVDRKAAMAAEEQHEIFRDLYDNGHKDRVDEGRRYERFYMGDQWDEKDLKELDKAGRPALTLNMVLSTINAFLGEQIGRRVDIQYKPHKDASSEEGHALSAVTRAIMEANQYDWRETDMVEDGAIRNAGYLNFRVSFDRNIQGEIEIDNLHPDSVMIERGNKSYDPQDWPGVIISTWDSLTEIEARFGEEKAKEVESMARLEGTLGSESVRYGGKDEEDPDQYEGPFATSPFTGEEQNRRIQHVRVIDRQYYRNTRIYMLVDPESMQQRELKAGTTAKQAKFLAERLGLPLRAKTARRLYWRVTADRVVLWEGWSPYKTPTVIPYFPYFRKGHFFGLVKNLISPQEQYNKVSSQELHIVNSTANGGWVVQTGALRNMTIDDLATQGSKTGAVLEVSDINKIDKIQPNQIPTGISSIKNDSQMAIRNIAGLSDAFVGADSQEISGVALKSKEQRGQVQIQKPLDNLARTRYLVGRKMLELIQEYYTDARIINAVDYQNPGMPSMEVPINMPQEDGSILNDFRRGEFSTNIATMPARDAYEDSQFAEILNMMSVGIPIPSYHAVMYSHLTQKDAISQEMKQIQGLQEPSEEEQEMQQIQQQMALQDMAASISEKQARIRELASKADLNMAKAQNEFTEEEREMRKLMKELQTERESYRVRLQLQQMQGMTKLDTEQLKMRGDLLKETLGGTPNDETNRA